MMRASFLVLFFGIIFGFIVETQARLGNQPHSSEIITEASVGKNAETSPSAKPKKRFFSRFRNSFRKEKQAPKKQAPAPQVKAPFHIVSKGQDVVVQSKKDVSTLVCHIDLEGITNTTRHPINYAQCRGDLAYVLDQLVQGYYFVKACPAYKNRAGDKRTAFGALADCLDKHMGYYGSETDAVMELRDRLQLFVPLRSIFKAVSTYLENHSPQETFLISTNFEGKKIPFNVERFLTDIIHLEPKYVDTDRLVVDTNHQATMILTLLFNTLVTRENFPQIHPIICKDKLIWHFDEAVLEKATSLEILSLISEAIAQTKTACAEKKVVLEALVKSLKKKSFDDIPALFQKQIKDLNDQVGKRHGSIFQSHIKPDLLRRIENIEAVLKMYEDLEQTVGFKTYVLGVLRAYAHGKTSLSLANKQGFKKTAASNGKSQRQAYHLTVSNVTELYDALANLAQDKGKDDFVISWIKALDQHLGKDVVPMLPGALQEQLSTTPRRIQDENTFHCQVADGKGSGTLAVVFNRKACQTDPVYALSAFYRLGHFRNVCARNSDFDGFHPSKEARSCLVSALKLMGQPGFEKTPAYEQLKPALKAIQDHVSYKRYFKSIQEGLAKSAGKKGFSVSSVTHFPHKQFAKWEGMRTIKFVTLDLVKGVSGYLNRSLQETQALVKGVEKSHTRREALKTLKAQEQEEALALLSVLAQKAKEAHSELIQCPGAKDGVFFNRFACTSNEEQTFAGLYDVLRISKQCPEKLRLLRDRVLAKCLTYFKEGKKAKNQPLFSAFPQDRVAALEEKVNLGVFLSSLQIAFNTSKDEFRVPLAQAKVGKPLTIPCSIKELQLRFDAASRNKKLNNQPPALIAFGVIERYLNKKVEWVLKEGAY